MFAASGSCFLLKLSAHPSFFPQLIPGVWGESPVQFEVWLWRVCGRPAGVLRDGGNLSVGRTGVLPSFLGLLDFRDTRPLIL